MLTESVSPGSTRGVLLEPAGAANALVDVRTRQDDSSPHSPASDKESSEARKGDTATSPSNNQSSNVEKTLVATGKYRRERNDESSYDENFTRDFGDESSSREPETCLRDMEQPEVTGKYGKRMDDHSPYDKNVSRHFGYTGTEIPPEDPIEVDWKSPISKYAERPWDLQKTETSPSKQKLGTLMYMGNALRHKRWVTPIQRIETLAPSYPDRLPSLITPAFTGCEHPVQHLNAAAGSEKRYLPPQMTAVFTGHSPPPSEGLWTDSKFKVQLCIIGSTLMYYFRHSQSGTGGRCTGESRR
jgi:hypothetical protein